MFYYQHESKLILNCFSLTESHSGGPHKHSACQISGISEIRVERRKPPCATQKSASEGAEANELG